MKNHKKWLTGVLILSLVGLIVSTLLIQHHYAIFSKGFESRSYCAISDFVDCDVVIASPYSKLFGIPTAELAFLYFFFFTLASLVVLFSEKDRSRTLQFLLPLSLFGVIDAAWMAYLSFFKLHALCILCASLYVVLLLILIALLAALRLAPWRLPSFLWNYAAGTFRRGEANNKLGLHLISFGAVLLIGLIFFVGLNDKVHGREPVLNTERILNAFEQIKALDIKIPEGRPQRGDPHSKVTILDFADFQCPHCRHFSFSIKPLLGAYRDKVNLVFMNYPLFGPCNPKSPPGEPATRCMAAKAALCANEKGEFWDYHELLFENQRRLSYDRMVGFAKELGMEEESFRACLASPEIDKKLSEELALADSLGVNSTPSIYINGRLLRHWASAELLQAIVKAELAK